jgi:hypothetical protein
MVASLAGSPVAVQAQSAPDREVAEWNAARGAGTPQSYQRYLELYPLGRYSGDAFRCMIELTVDPEVISSCAAAPGAGPGAQVVTSSTRGLAVDLY